MSENIIQNTLTEQLNHYSIEKENLHHTNQDYLDWGRIDISARKLKSMRSRLNIETLNDLSSTERITSINKHTMWIETFDDLSERGFSPFGSSLYHTIKRSISMRPVSSMDTILHLNNNPVVNAEMMSVLYLWANNQVLEAFEKRPVSTPLDAVLLLRDLTERGICFPTEQIEADSEESKLLQDYGTFDYVDLDFLGAAGKLEKVTMNLTGAKQFMMEQFPDYADELSQYPNLLFNQIVGAQMGKQFRNKIIYFEHTLAKINANLSTFDFENSDMSAKNANLFLKNGMSESDDGLLNLLQEMSCLDTMRIRYIGLGRNGTVVQNNSNMALHNKNLHNVERTGFDWIGDSTIDNSDIDENDIANHLNNDLENVFNIGGVQWGASVNGSYERKEWTKLLSESFADLAFALNISEESIGLEYNGKSLGVAIGTNGKRNSVAHYSPAKHYLHLNRNRSTGTLAHEWTHAYDNLLFKQAVSQNLFPDVVMDKLLNYGVHDSYFNALYEFLHLKNYEDYPQYENIKAFDPALLSLAENVWGRKDVILSNDNAGQEFVQNFNNYDNRENFFNKVDQYVESSIDDYRTTIKTISGFMDTMNELHSNDVDIVELVSKDKTFEHKVLHLNEKVNALVGYKADFFLDSTIYNKDDVNPEDLIRKNPHIHITDNPDDPNSFIVKQAGLKNFMESSNEVYAKIASAMRDYRENILPSSNLALLKENAFKNMVDIEQASYNYFKNHPSNNDKINLLINESVWQNVSENGLADVDAIRKDLFSKPIFVAAFEDSLNKGLNSLKVGLKDVFKHPETNKPIMLFGMALQQMMKNDSVLNGALKNAMMGRLTQDIHQSVLDNGLSLSLGTRTSHLVTQSYLADKVLTANIYDKRVYFAKPQEIFARLGESLVFNTLNDLNFKNLFLCEAHHRRFMNNGYEVYPIGQEKLVFNDLFKQSFKNHFPEFSLKPENINSLNIIENEYQLNDEPEIKPTNNNANTLKM